MNVDTRIGALVGEASTVETRRPDVAYPLDKRALPTTARGVSTYFEMPMLKKPVWKGWIPLYFYTGGIVGAAATLGAAAQLVGGPALRRLTLRARWTAMIFSAISAGLLVVDLGRPSRFLYMLRVVRPTSPMNVGTWIVSASGATSALAAILPRTAVGERAGLAAGAIGMPMAGYTAVLLANTAVPAWNGAARSLPALFVASGATAAASLFDLLDLDPAEARAVKAFGVAGKLGEMIAMRAVEAELAREGARVARPIRRSALWRAARILTTASLAASLVPGGGRAKRIASGLLGTAGAIALRFAVMRAGKASALDPRASFEPQRRRAEQRKTSE